MLLGSTSCWKDVCWVYTIWSHQWLQFSPLRHTQVWSPSGLPFTDYRKDLQWHSHKTSSDCPRGWYWGICLRNALSLVRQEKGLSGKARVRRWGKRRGQILACGDRDITTEGPVTLQDPEQTSILFHSWFLGTGCMQTEQGTPTEVGKAWALPSRGYPVKERNTDYSWSYHAEWDQGQKGHSNRELQESTGRRN